VDSVLVDAVTLSIMTSSGDRTGATTIGVTTRTRGDTKLMEASRAPGAEQRSFSIRGMEEGSSRRPSLGPRRRSHLSERADADSLEFYDMDTQPTGLSHEPGSILPITVTLEQVSKMDEPEADEDDYDTRRPAASRSLTPGTLATLVEDVEADMETGKG
jgi:hypothetical protein